MLVSHGIIFKVIMGDELTCIPKNTCVQLGQHRTGCSTKTLASAGSNCSDTTKNPKMTPKEEAQFYFTPSPHTYTHTCAGAIHKGSVFIRVVINPPPPCNHPITQKLPPYPPPRTKIYQIPYAPPPSACCTIT